MRNCPETSPNSEIPPETAEAHEILPGRADRGLILLCDHAANRLPSGYGDLGLGSSQLSRHIAYDIGAAEVTAGLARMLDVPAVRSRYSRLLIDLNRGLDDPTLVMRLSDGAIVPGNRMICADEREKRIRLYYQPYHDAVSRVIDRCCACGHPPAIVSLHSFTETWKGSARPWHAGVLWDSDARLAQPMLSALRADPDLVVGDNQPYSGHLEGDTMWTHGTGRGLPHALIEIRQDLIRDGAGQAAWAMRLAELLRRLAPLPDLRFDLPELSNRIKQ